MRLYEEEAGVKSWLAKRAQVVWNRHAELGVKLRMQPGGGASPAKKGISETVCVTDGLPDVDFRLDCGSRSAKDQCVGLVACRRAQRTSPSLA